MCDGCTIGKEFLATDSNQFHFTPEDAPVFESGDGNKYVLYKESDPNIKINPEAKCAIIASLKYPSTAILANFPCYECGERIFIRPAHTEAK